jgi:protein-tyrosine phosphatase
MTRIRYFLIVAFITCSVAAADPATQPNRSLGFAGAPNFRDLGGYQTADGHHVRYRLVYRSENLSNLTPADEQRLEDLHIEAEIDLRTAEERQNEPDRWQHLPPDIYNSPKSTLTPKLKSLFAAIHDAKSARSAIDKFYANMPNLYRGEYAAFFRRLVNGEYPIVVHCTAGKDRTGVASAILLSVLGVPQKTVIADYMLTNQLLPVPSRQPTSSTGPVNFAIDQLPDDAREELWRTREEYIHAALDAITRQYGSVDGYIKAQLGLTPNDIITLRKKLLH